MPSVGHVFHSKLLQPLLTPKKKLSIYDFGCGAGELLDVLPESSIATYEGVDINSHSIHRAKQKFPQKKFIFHVNQPTQVPSKRSTKFDVFISIGVFQYLPLKLQAKVLKEANQKLKKGGTLALSCATDHGIYKLLNIYQYVIPHSYINRKKLEHMIRKQGFTITYSAEKGLIISPLFSHVIVFFFDIIDKVFFRTRGDLGPVGKTIRNTVRPLTTLEYQLPIDYGYTLFIQATKK